MQPSGCSSLVARDRDVVRLVGGREPRARFGPVIQDDLLGDSEAEALLKELACRRDVACQEIDVIETSRRNATRYVSLRLVLESGRNVWRCLESLRFPVQFDGMAIRCGHAIRRAMPHPVSPRDR